MLNFNQEVQLIFGVLNAKRKDVKIAKMSLSLKAQVNLKLKIFAVKTAK